MEKQIFVLIMGAAAVVWILLLRGVKIIIELKVAVSLLLGMLVIALSFIILALIEMVRR